MRHVDPKQIGGNVRRTNSTFLHVYAADIKYDIKYLLYLQDFEGQRLTWMLLHYILIATTVRNSLVGLKELNRTMIHTGHLVFRRLDPAIIIPDDVCFPGWLGGPRIGKLELIRPDRQD